MMYTDERLQGSTLTTHNIGVCTRNGKSAVLCDFYWGGPKGTCIEKPFHFTYPEPGPRASIPRILLALRRLFSYPGSMEILSVEPCKDEG